MAIAADILNYVAASPGIIVSIFLLYVFIYVLSILISAPKPGPNPFRSDKSRPPQELVTDQSARDKVLKQGFNTKKVPDNVDAIVIGSGIGGLTAAAILSKAGKKVLVLEQHDQAGGCCHTFIDKGFEFDVGIHYIGEMRNNTVARLLVQQISEGQLQWVDLIDEFDVVAIGEPGAQKFYPFRSGGYDAWRTKMVEMFPKEEKAIDEYIRRVKEVRASTLGLLQTKVMNKWPLRFLINTGLINKMTKYFQLSKHTLKDVVDSLTDNKDLRAVLSYSFGDYGTVPSEASFAMHAGLVNHYMYGASYPRGGSSEIAFNIIPVIEKSGGKVMVRAPVSEILFDSKGKARGVRVDRSSGPVDIFAPMVISDAGVVNTFKSLVPPHIADKSSISRLIGKQVDSGGGCMSLFVGLKGTAEELGIKGCNYWSFTGNDIDGLAKDFLSKDVEDMVEEEIPLLFVSFPSAKDPTFNQRYPGKTVCEVVTLARWDWFSKWEGERVMKRGEDYETLKSAVGKRMWDQTLSIYPQLADKVEYFDIATPATNKYYLNAPKGEIYGLDHTVKRFGDPEVAMTLRPDTDVPGLFITGQDAFSCGFMGAMFGGLLCGSRILNRNIFQDLLTLKKEVSKAK